MALAEERVAEGVDLVAEALEVRERLVTAPMPGRFHPVAAEGDELHPGQRIGAVVRGGEVEPVVTAFAGVLMGLLVLPGERVRRGQPVAWLS